VNGRAPLGDGSEVDAAWLSQVLGAPVVALRVESGHGNWSRQFAIAATLAGGGIRALRLKVCRGDTFGRSEVDYYTRDYVDMPAAPLVRCFDARFEAGVGYHLLLEDLSATHADRRDAVPTLAHGLAVAEALGRMHRHHWQTRSAPDEAALDRYFAAIRPGLGPIERETGVALGPGFDRQEQAMRQRWRQPQGMSLLHGDLNPTNILTPCGAQAPVLFIDRQPFDWSLTYGLAVSDLALFMLPWWPVELRAACEEPVLRCWHAALGRADYSWAQAQADWRLAVEQCMHIPIEWCSSEASRVDMRWLWTQQLERVRSALA
jgi:hypothetical protein